jgi:anti-anti-sigma factor
MIGVALPHRWDGHQLVLASAAADGPALVGWVERGLRRHEKMLYAGSGEQKSLDELTTVLAAYGVNACGAAEDGRLEIVEPARFYSTDGYSQLVDQAHLEGYSGVRTYGGPDVAADVVSAAEFAQFERVAERLWTELAVTAFCRYDPPMATDPDRLANMITAHSSGWGDQMVHAYCGESGQLCLEGEVDPANDVVFAAMLSAAAAAVERSLVVECAALRFMSVSAWRAAVNATAALRERGGRVVLSDVSPLGRDVLRVTGFGEAFEEVS